MDLFLEIASRCRFYSHRMTSNTVVKRSWLWMGLFAILLSGCVSRTTHRTTADASARATAVHKILVLPLDVEVSELSAGGMLEKRDDWTGTVIDNLTDSVARLTPIRSVTSPAPPPADELLEVQVLYRMITVNQFLHSFYGPSVLTSVHGPLGYRLGAIDSLLAPAGADAALVVFVRDDYATGGRKAVAFVGAIAGIPVRTGVTISSAALVARDGTILWMNQQGATHGDLRTQPGADATVRKLFTGLPALATR